MKSDECLLIYSNLCRGIDQQLSLKQNELSAKPMLGRLAHGTYSGE
jgi:hypothetical protein